MDKHQAIFNTHPEVVTINGDSSAYNINGELVSINDTLVNNEVTRLKSEYAASQYQRDRADEYPPIGDQLDALFHAGVFPVDMAAKIQAVKDKHPKS